jgi:dUTP pyrophosphatase
MDNTKDDLNKFLEKLKEYESILENDDDETSDDIEEALAEEINQTLNELGEYVMEKQQEEFQKLSLKFINKSKNQDPSFANEGDSGFDLRASLDEPVILDTLQRALIPTGLFFELEKGYEIQVRPRSGLAIKNGIFVLNSPGTVDSHYRGEVKIILINFGEPFTINPGDRIAQAVVCPVFGEGKIYLENTDSINDTKRGADGFGSSGIS